MIRRSEVYKIVKLKKYSKGVYERDKGMGR